VRGVPHRPLGRHAADEIWPGAERAAAQLAVGLGSGGRAVQGGRLPVRPAPDARLPQPRWLVPLRVHLEHRRRKNWSTTRLLQMRADCRGRAAGRPAAGGGATRVCQRVECAVHRAGLGDAQTRAARIWSRGSIGSGLRSPTTLAFCAVVASTFLSGCATWSTPRSSAPRPAPISTWTSRTASRSPSRRKAGGWRSWPSSATTRCDPTRSGSADSPDTWRWPRSAPSRWASAPW